MLPKYYEFYNPVKIVAGVHSLENIPFELKTRGAKKPMILCNEQLLELGVVKKAVAGIEESPDVEIGCIYKDVPVDSSVDVVNDAARIFRKKACDSIVAVGGGSVIDTAKGLTIVINMNADDIIDYMGCEIVETKERIPFIVVPTTAGTGSEVTMVAVIKNPSRGIKMEFISANLLPDVAVLDPVMTASLPPRITASTGIDAMTHAIEGYTCSQKNPLSDAYSTAAIKLIAENLPKAVENGKDEKVRLALANASLMAGVSFSNSMVGLVHAIGHSAGGVSHLPHGDAMSILLPYCMEYNMDTLGELYGELLLCLAGEEVYAKTEPEKRGEAAVDAVRALQREMLEKAGLPMTLSAAGVPEEDLPLIAKNALNDGAIICNPKDAGEEEVLAILKRAY